jgi:hypothetical protein
MSDMLAALHPPRTKALGLVDLMRCNNVACYFSHPQANQGQATAVTCTLDLATWPLDDPSSYDHTREQCSIPHPQGQVSRDFISQKS